MRENFTIYVQISGPNSNIRTFQDKFQNFRTTAQAWMIQCSPQITTSSMHIASKWRTNH